MKLKGKTVLITGASSGIGRAIALRCADDTCTIILASRDEQKLNEVKKEVEKKGSVGIVIPTDVTKVDNVRNLFIKATEGGRCLDVVIDNAGLGFIAPIYDLTVDQIQAMISVNVLGMILVAKFATEVMVKQKNGHLVMTSSLAGLITLPEWSVYVATKWAITGFADSIRQELKKFNIKVTTIHPGAVKTDFFAKEKANIDIAKLGDAIGPEVVADAVYDALFTNKKKILVPSMAKSYSLLYKYMPGLVQTLIEKMSKGVELHTEGKEDEPGFSYVSCCKNG